MEILIISLFYRIYLPMDKSKVIHEVGEHLDARISKSTVVVEWIKGNLFDILTLWDNKNDREELWTPIKKELEEKITIAKKAEPPRKK